MRYILIILLASFLPTILPAQDPDIEADEKSAFEAIYRSSDEPGEIPVSPRRAGHKKRVSVPEGAFRIGCVCMDESPSNSHSIGACSGHGGVRYWLYRTREGDTVRVLTARHERHPQPLNAEELSSIAQKKVAKVKTLQAANPNVATLQPAPPVVYVPLPEQPVNYFEWKNVPGLAVAAIALYASLRLLLRWIDRNPEIAKYALRNLLRHRKRPAPRKPRKTPPAPRL